MKCRSCDAEIDAKAIVCYRCGTPTAIPATSRPGPPVRTSAGWRWAAVVVLAVLAVAAYIYYH